MSYSTTQGYRVIEFTCVEDVEDLLRQFWPDGWIPRWDLFQRFGITSPIEKNMLISELGISEEVYKIADVADFLWDNSNYGRAEQDN